MILLNEDLSKSMKMEINVGKKDLNKGAHTDEITVQSPSCNVAIDVGHVLAANQALLKNMARKMNNLETKISVLQTAYAEQSRLIARSMSKKPLLLAPPKTIKAWENKKPILDKKYYEKFSIIDRIFRPWVLRRPS